MIVRAGGKLRRTLHCGNQVAGSKKLRDGIGDILLNDKIAKRCAVMVFKVEVVGQ
jgi:hypothetical protein